VTRQSQGLIQQAVAAFSRGDLGQTRALCRRVLDANPEAVDALNLLSLVHKRSGESGQAEALMSKALELDPGRADIRANLGNLYTALRRVEEAELAYRQALRDRPTFRAARLGLARLLHGADRIEEALAEATALVEANARDAEAWNVLGTTNRALGRVADAEDAFRKAIGIAPAYAVARHNLGALLASVSRNQEALEELDQAAAAGLTGSEVDHNRASAMMALGRFDEAESLLENAIRDTPLAVSLQMLLARIRYMRGDERFADRLRQAVADNPEVVELLIACSQILRGAGQLGEAASVLGGASAHAKADARLLAELSALSQDRGDYAVALDLAERAVSVMPGDARLGDLVIQALLSLGRGAEAMPLIEDLRRRIPMDQFYIALEATAARQAGDARYASLYDYERLVQRYELPVPPGWSSIDDFHADLIPVLRDRHRFVAPPLDQSLRGGTQTPGGLSGDPDPVIRAFLETIKEPIGEYCSKLGTDPGHPLSARNTGAFRLIGCWSVLLRRDGFHVNHVHSEGWISSAYYVQVPDEVADQEAQSGWIKFGEPKFFVPDAKPEKIVQPAVGTLVLFPSYMWHGTTPILGDEPRMTIAFDVVPVE
jgi:Flp pilus assembly protein TadD